MSPDWSREPGATGGCLCGAVRYRLDAPLRPIVACHCGQCRRSHGTFGAYTAAPVSALCLEAEGDLAWYRSSARAERGFCRACGSSLFWRPVAGSYVAVAAGSLDDATGLALVEHIFVADKPAWYELSDALPRRAGGLASPLLTPATDRPPPDPSPA
ncbi:GFA family protein [Benzoatithermus flavus]|uniref:GFA family protein n=1 Tax=Benzoatithermus flavus TaxID=3108223 RepID=A0ABU8XTG1_9PROT